MYISKIYNYVLIIIYLERNQDTTAQEQRHQGTRPQMAL